MFGPLTLPSDCRRELNDIQARATKYGAKYNKEEITIDCSFHYFVLDEYVKQSLDKPESVAFGYSGLSVRVEGGPFGKLSKQDLCRELIEYRKQTKKQYVGIVCWTAQQIMDNNHDLKFLIEHDPYPFVQNKVRIEQGRRHAQIICDKKRGGRRELLMDLMEWSLKPEEFIQLTEKMAKARLIMWLLILLAILGAWLVISIY